MARFSVCILQTFILYGMPESQKRTYPSGLSSYQATITPSTSSASGVLLHTRGPSGFGARTLLLINFHTYIRTYSHIGMETCLTPLHLAAYMK